MDNPDGMRKRAVAHLMEVVAAIPSAQKEAYTEAVRRCPEIVENESDPMSYLRVDDFNAWKAADRLTSYWRMRHQIYGERAFRSLEDLSGEGVLDIGDLQFFSSGLGVVLPDDESGRAVLCFDFSKHPADLSTETKLRFLFYTFYLLTLNERSQEEGCVIFMVKSDANFDRRSAAWVSSLFRNILPFRLYKYHFVYPPPKSGVRSFFDTIVPTTIRLFGNLISASAEFHVHLSKEEILHALEARGFRREGLPPTLGGTWNYDVHFRDWLESQGFLSSRQALDGGTGNSVKEGDDDDADDKRLLVQQALHSFVPSKLDSTMSESVVGVAPATKPTRLLTPDEKRARKRTLRALYSRNKRARQKTSMQSLEKDYSEVQIERKILESEHIWLETLLKDANELLLALAGGALASNEKSPNATSHL